MWKKKIKRKKMQFALISIILIVASSIFAISISFTSTASRYTERYYKGENIKDIVVQTYNNNTVSKIEEFIKEKEPNEKDVRKAKGLMIDKRVFLGSENLDLSMTTLIAYENKESHPWDVVITKGENKATPSIGTVWVPNILADSKGLKIGDKLKFKDGNEYRYLTISALINESLVPSSVTSSSNLYINNDDYNSFHNILKSQFIGYNSSKEGLEATSQLTSYIGDSINGVVYDKWTIIFAANSTNQMTSAIGLSTAVLIFIASIIIIRFIIWNNILKEYRSIGIHKALGFTSGQIRNIYLKSFGIIGVISITIGSFISIGLINYLVKISVKYIGIYEGNTNSFIFIALTIFLMSFILISNIYLLLRRINNINPIEALRIVVTSSKEKFKKSIIRDASTTLSMAINDIFKYKKQNLVICTVLTLVMYLSVFLVSANYTAVNMKYNAWNIFGVVQGDITLDFPLKDENYNSALEDIKKDANVLEVRECSLDVGKAIYLDKDKYNIKSPIVVTYLYDNYEEKNGFNVSIIKGRNPKSTNEISVSNEVLKDSKLDIGDYIKVKVLGEEKKLLITGTYKSMVGNQYSMRLKLDIVPSEGMDSLHNLSINATLKDKNDYDNFKKKYQEKYEECSIDVCPNLVVTSAKSVIDMVNPITNILLIGILLFSILNIVNLIVVNNNDNRRSNVIMKSLGFSTIYILKRTVYRIMVLVGVSSIVSFILNSIISKSLFKLALMGIDGLMIPYGKVVFTICGISMVTIFMAAITMFSIRKISTVELVEE